MSMALRSIFSAALLVAPGSALRLEAQPQDHGHGEGDSEHPFNHTFDEITNKLWYGFDVGHEEQGFLERAPRTVYFTQDVDANNYPVLPPNTPKPKLAVLAPKDSGMSLLMQTLEFNYREELGEACGWSDLFIDHDRPWTDHLFCRVWPHGIVAEDGLKGAPALYEAMQEQAINTQDLVLVIVVKSPLATLDSWAFADREKTPCMDRPTSEWDTECTAKDVTWKARGNRAKETESGLPVTSTMEILNEYWSMYNTLLKDKRFSAVLLVKYEQLVLNTADEVDKIAEAMFWTPRTAITVVEGPRAGTGPPAAGRATVLDEVQGDRWLHRIPKETRLAWCAGLNSKAYRGVPGFVDHTYDGECKYEIEHPLEDVTTTTTTTTTTIKTAPPTTTTTTTTTIDPKWTTTN